MMLSELKQLIKEIVQENQLPQRSTDQSFPHIKTKEDYIGGIYQGEVRAEPIPTGKVQFYNHNDFKGLYSGYNSTNWRYSKEKNMVTWNTPPEPESVELVNDFLMKRGISNPKHKSKYTYDENILKEDNDVSDWSYWWMDSSCKLYPVEREEHSAFAWQYLVFEKGLKTPDIKGKNVYYLMYNLGWVRLGLARYLDKMVLAFNYNPDHKPTSRQMKAIQDLAKERGADEIRDNVTGKFLFIDESLGSGISINPDIQKEKEEDIKRRIPTLKDDDIRITVQKDDRFPQANTVQVDDISAGQNHFSANPELMTKLGFPMPTTQQFLAALPRGQYKLSAIKHKLGVNEIDYPMAKGDDMQSYEGQEGWKGKIIWMSPEKFLKLASPLPSWDLERRNTERWNRIRDRLSKGLPTDFLVLTVDMEKKRVTGHEGRHRAHIAKELGIEKVPVLIYTGNMFERVPKWDKATHDLIDKADFAPER